ncbi:hypothetical protein UFOVP180_2 [uncultured Caudovirales phage]|uniref:Uncharacterized protein n=1 Tax=uncultured Caudovirales phage TaxID=2100421 RepID=A0A6J7WC96_9CAUD|nr:hypothetical protein UFOVP180_2 [uncultured Caudovirales phage]
MNIPKMKSNFGLGPRTGNTNTGDKRESFKSGKAERSNLADSINNVFASMKVEDYTNPRLEGKAPTVKPRKFSK